MPASVAPPGQASIVVGLLLIGERLIGKGVRLSAEVAIEILVLAVDVHGDVGNASLILVVDVVEAEAAIDSQILIDLVGGTKLESEDVLLTVDVALYGVARRVASQSEVDAILLLVGGVGQLQNGGQQGHLALEGSETAVEGTLTATAHEAEGKLKSPLVVVQGRLYRRYERAEASPLKLLIPLASPPLRLSGWA